MAALMGLTEPLASDTEVQTHDLGHLSHDPDLAAKILKKRQEEVMRRQRLMNPRTRQFGVSHAVLEAQVAEKRDIADAAVSEETFHDNNQLLQDEVSQACENAKQSAMRQREIETKAFALTHLRQEHRREYDLSDPLALRKTQPLQPYYDPNLGASSMQVFQGEDLDVKARKREAQSMQRQWLVEQMEQKEMKARMEREEDMAYDRASLLANEVRTCAEQDARDEAREDKHDEAATNRQLIEEKRSRNDMRRSRDLSAIAMHVDNVCNSDRMTERIDQAYGLDGKLQRAEYKRLTLEQEQEVYLANATQARDKLARTRAEKAEEDEHAANVLRGTMVLTAIGEESSRQARQRHMKMIDDNRLLASEKKTKDAEDKRTYKCFA